MTAARRPLPGLLVIGAVKAGTTTLHHALARHPDLMPPAIKEIHYFDRPQNYAGGPGWYRSHWPVRAPGQRWIAYESTPFYLPVPAAPHRMRTLLPDATLVVLLRNPTERAISHHAHQVRLGHESLPIREALSAEEGRLATHGPAATRALTHYGYRTQGHYAEQLTRVFACFPRDHVVVITSEELATSPDEHVGRLLDRIGLSQMSTSVSGMRLNSGPATDVDEGTRSELNHHFGPWNRALEELLGRRLTWPTD